MTAVPGKRQFRDPVRGAARTEALATRAGSLGRDRWRVITTDAHVVQPERALAERPGSAIADTGFGRRLLGEAERELLPRSC